MQHRLSAATYETYDWCWRRFTRWSAEMGRAALPANVETVKLFVAWSVQNGWRLATVRLCLASIRYQYRQANLTPPIDESVQQLMRSAARALKERSRAKLALTPQQLRRVIKNQNEATVIGMRNRAMLLLTFALGWRRSEVAGLELADVRFVEMAVIVRLGASKTDQEGKGREVRIPMGSRKLTCPIRALQAWLQIRGKWQGPLFCVCTAKKVRRAPIDGEVVCYVLKKALERIGENPAPYGAHSLRAGMVTAATENGATESSIMHRTGWRSHRTLQRYVRPAKPFRLDPLAGVL